MKTTSQHEPDWLPQPQDSLEQMITVTWSAAPPMPQGMQDNDGGIVGDYLVMACGFCHGYDDDWKPGKYPRGFLKKVWALNLTREEQGWVELPDFPGCARQEMYGVSVHDALYLWGGLNYSSPYSYRDGYKLSFNNGAWLWTELPALPWPMAAGAICADGGKIYLFGGADYNEGRLSCLADRTGKVERLGARLLMFDTEAPGDGWRQIAECPGTPRVSAGMAAVDGAVYIIGGDSPDYNEETLSEEAFAGQAGEASSDEGVPTRSVGTVVDCWRFDPPTSRWQRRRDLPVAVAGFGSGRIVYRDRYMLLAAGYRRKMIVNPDGTLRPGYGRASRVDRSTWKQHPSLAGWRYFNDVWVYDTRTNCFGTATALPYDDAAPSSYVIGDTWYLFPGETAGFEWEGEYFGHAPEFVLKGRIEDMVVETT